ncbi:hypothetical protein GCM10010282_53430 [Streptomyces roseolus]|nr:hypothetical protein GCM10010282_53430 [Streptomyces roseolus]
MNPMVPDATKDRRAAALPSPAAETPLETRVARLAPRTGPERRGLPSGRPHHRYEAARRTRTGTGGGPPVAREESRHGR